MKKALKFALLIGSGFLFLSGHWCWGLFALWAWIINLPHVLTLGFLLLLYLFKQQKSR
jgi:hypothetical protein